ncbi:MAG: hypothetical protein HOE19_03510 [Candidatus Komeilibacteria bacterium]|jgi:hypothetical protein|nr:hypothetical protein [Candidatus Komeilibacteria bacterium]MBT4447743.1 hypothetical protein [Candidatus Komeilibacteria bacterium]
MANDYLEGKITKYKLYNNFIVALLIVCAFFIGHIYPFESQIGSFLIGILLAIISIAIINITEGYIKKQTPYSKGLDLETQLAQKLKKLDINYEQNINTKYGDLDFLVTKNNKYFGIEVKNWAGLVTFKNNLLKVSNYDHTKVLNDLLMHCSLVKDIKFGEESSKFIKPILIFGHKSVINIPQNKIKFKNVEIKIIKIEDFKKFI